VLPRPTAGMMLDLGISLGRLEDVSLATVDDELLIRDQNNPPQSIDAYLGKLCAVNSQVYISPTIEQRSILMFSLGWAAAIQDVANG